MPGPVPKPAGQRRRRNATIAMTQLPSEGRRGRTPRWPLIPDIATAVRRDLAAAKIEVLEAELEELREAGKGTAGCERKLDAASEHLAIAQARLREQRGLEAKLWREAWATPQATMWERLGWMRDVAAYVRHKVLGELGELEHAKEARQWSDRLGLTPMSMLRLRWEVVVDETAVRREQRAAAAAVDTSAADPLAVLRLG